MAPCWSHDSAGKSNAHAWSGCPHYLRNRSAGAEAHFLARGFSHGGSSAAPSRIEKRISSARNDSVGHPHAQWLKQGYYWAGEVEIEAVAGRRLRTEAVRR